MISLEFIKNWIKNLYIDYKFHVYTGTSEFTGNYELQLQYDEAKEKLKSMSFLRPRFKILSVLLDRGSVCLEIPEIKVSFVCHLRTLEFGWFPVKKLVNESPFFIAYTEALSFQQVFELCPEKIQHKMLYHLDLLNQPGLKAYMFAND